MKSKKGIGHIKTVVLLMIILIIGYFGLSFVKQQYQEAKVKTIITNMSLLELKAKEYIQKQKTEGSEIQYLGCKLSEWNDNPLAELLQEKEVISAEEQEKYYVLLDEDLEKLNVGFSNEEEEYYLINYEEGEVILSSGCQIAKDKILYKLSQIKMEQ